MKNKVEFKSAMHALGVNFKTDITEEHLALYWRQLADLTDEEFQRAVQHVVATERFWPPVAMLRAAARPKQNVLVAASAAFEQIEKLGVYNPHGYRWSVATIREKLGDAAAEAFVAAGGESAWVRNDSREWPFVRKAFLDAYAAHRPEDVPMLSGATRAMLSPPRT